MFNNLHSFFKILKHSDEHIYHNPSTNIFVVTFGKTWNYTSTCSVSVGKPQMTSVATVILGTLSNISDNITNDYKWVWYNEIDYIEILCAKDNKLLYLSLRYWTTRLKSSIQYSRFMSARTLSEPLCTGQCRKEYILGLFIIFDIS